MERVGNKAAAAKEYRSFIQKADVLEYSRLIQPVLDKIVDFETP